MEKSLGLIETIGLTAAIEAADAAVKSANVALIGYELAKGDGMVTVKIEGDVGAVNAAVSSAESAAGSVGTVVSTKVIARPAEGLTSLVRSPETVGITKTVAATEEKEDSKEKKEEVAVDKTEQEEAKPKKEAKTGTKNVKKKSAK